MSFNQNTLNALTEGSDGEECEEWGGLRHYAMTEILGGEDTNGDIDSTLMMTLILLVVPLLPVVITRSFLVPSLGLERSSVVSLPTN